MSVLDAASNQQIIVSQSMQKSLTRTPAGFIVTVSMQIASRVLLRLRLRQGWTQTELAHRAAVSPRTIAKMENGCWPRPSTLKQVADALGVDVDVLIIEADDTGVVVELSGAADLPKQECG